MARQSRQAQMPTLLLTRPAARSDRFADQLRTRFGPKIRIVTSPLLSLVLLSPPRPAMAFRAVIFTSETGIEGFRRLSAEPGLTAWCVGDRTAAAARQAGFQAQSAGADVTALADAIRRAGVEGPLLYARGRQTAGDLASHLIENGFMVHEMVVYDQLPQPLSPQAAQLLSGGGPVIAPVFSARTAALLAGDPAVVQRKVPLWIAALSPAVAAACVAARAEKTDCATHPDADALLAAVARLFAISAQP